MSDNDNGASFDNESEGSESESWLAEQVRLITLEDGLA
jgi:hypothetical protein